MSYPCRLHAHARHIAVAQIRALADLAQGQRHKTDGDQCADISVEPAISVEQPHSNDEHFQEFHPAFPFFWAGWIRAAVLDTPSRTPRLVTGQSSTDSKVLSSGGSPVTLGAS